MRLTTRVLALSAATLFARSISAQTYREETGTPFNTAAITTSNTFGFNMDGMVVTGYNAAGTPVTAVWSDLFATSSMFALFLRSSNLSTSQNTWRLRVLSGELARITLSGAAGRTVFDRTFDFTDGTPNTLGGIDFGYLLGDSRNTTVTYRNAVGVGGAAPVGDIFETLDIEFGTPIVAGTFEDFMLDTDNSAANSPIVPAVTPTPEPASALLLGAGLALVAVGRQRSRRLLAD